MSNISHNFPWVESPFFNSELAASGLSEEDKAFVKQYAENGYAVFDPGLSDAMIEDIKKELESGFVDVKADHFR